MSILLEVKNNWNKTKEEIKEKFAVFAMEESLKRGQSDTAFSLHTRISTTKEELQNLISSL